MVAGKNVDWIVESTKPHQEMIVAYQPDTCGVRN